MSCLGLMTSMVCAIGRALIERAARHLWPFWLAMLVVWMQVTYIPPLTMWILRFSRTISGVMDSRSAGVDATWRAAAAWA